MVGTSGLGSVLTSLSTKINELSSDKGSEMDEVLKEIKRVNDHVNALENNYSELQVAKNKITEVNAEIGEYNELVSEEESRLDDKISNSKRIIRMSNYEFERNKEFKNMFKTMAYISLAILLLIFLQRRFGFMKMPGNFLIIGLGVYLVVFIIERTIYNFNRYNINYSELHKAHSENKK
tara:strand:- start:4674 stop:5210 length:537 start_codon:yes stop_codon:yes gene_type:complete